MREAGSWRESKYVLVDGVLRASLDPAQVSPASWFVADRQARAYQGALQRYARGRLLDLGAGYVPLYAAYRDRVDAVTCVDWAGTTHPSPHLDLELDLNEPLCFGDASFDTVLCTDVLEHLRRPRAALAEIRRCLAPGGHLILGVPFLYAIHEIPHDYFRYTEFGLRMLLEEAGLEVLELEALGGSPELAVDLLCKHLLPLGRAARIPGRLGALACRLPGIRHLSRYSAARFPLAYLAAARRPAGRSE